MRAGGSTKRPSGAVTGFSFSPDNQRLVTISDDETVRLFDVALSCEVHLLDTEKGNDGAVLFGYGGKHILRSRSSELASWGNEWPISKLQAESETERADRLKRWHSSALTLAYRQQQWRAARSHATALMALGDSTQLYQRGLLYSFEGRWEAAEEDLRACLDTERGLLARCQLARVVLKQNRTDEYRQLCMQLCDELHDELAPEDVNRIAWMFCPVRQFDAVCAADRAFESSDQEERQFNLSQYVGAGALPGRSFRRSYRRSQTFYQDGAGS